MTEETKEEWLHWQIRTPKYRLRRTREIEMKNKEVLKNK